MSFKEDLKNNINQMFSVLTDIRNLVKQTKDLDINSLKTDVSIAKSKYDMDAGYITKHLNRNTDAVKALEDAFYAWQYGNLEDDSKFADIIMIPYDYYNNDICVIHHGKRIDMKDFKNLTLDFDRDSTPVLTVDK